MKELNPEFIKTIKTVLFKNIIAYNKTVIKSKAINMFILAKSNQNQSGINFKYKST